MEYNNLTAVLSSIGQLVATEYKDKLMAGDVIASGKLYNSVGYKVEVGLTGITLKFVAADYYINVENGRVAGKFPPINAIQKWMVSRGLPNDDNIAYVIARSIERNGIRPRPYLQQSTADLINFKDEIEDAFKRDIEDMIKERLNLKNNGNIN